jgi:hypothetical protein
MQNHHKQKEWSYQEWALTIFSSFSCGVLVDRPIKTSNAGWTPSNAFVVSTILRLTT